MFCNVLYESEDSKTEAPGFPVIWCKLWIRRLVSSELFYKLEWFLSSVFVMWYCMLYHWSWCIICCSCQCLSTVPVNMFCWSTTHSIITMIPVKFLSLSTIHDLRITSSYYRYFYGSTYVKWKCMYRTLPYHQYHVLRTVPVLQTKFYLYNCTSYT